MVSRLALLFFTLTILASARCPDVTCSSLDSNVCAKQTAIFSYAVNKDGCNSGYTCSMDQYLSTIADTLTVTKTVPCITTPSSTTTSTTTWTPKQCAPKESTKGWTSGTALLLCQTDGDCLMQDSSTAKCLCVPRSDKNGVCKPDVSNQAVFSKYWLDCGSTNVISEKNSYVYWSYAINYWAYTQSDLSCSSIFLEIGNYNSLKGAYESAAALAAAAVSLLFLD